jgi:hypothetical protein
MKSFKKFETSKLTQDGFDNVKGGRAACTCRTNSVCHIDGTTDADCEEAISIVDY